MCRNWRTWAMLGGAALIVTIAVPGAPSAVLPLLLAVCPLSMAAMALGMARAARFDRAGEASPATRPAREPVGLSR